MGEDLNVCLHRGGGPSPGYLWNVLMISFVHHESMKFLDDSQYSHIAEQFRELAKHEDPARSDTISVRRVEDFHELRDKGGILGGLNVRVFYHLDTAQKAIVILGAMTKQNDGPTLQADKIRIRRRLRKYSAGDYGTAAINAQRIGAGKKDSG